MINNVCSLFDLYVSRIIMLGIKFSFDKDYRVERM